MATLKRVLVIGILLAAGVPTSGNPRTAPLGVLPSAVGLPMLALPSYIERTRSH